MRVPRLVLSAFAAVPLVMGAVAPATAAPIPAATITYDGSATGNYNSANDQGAQIWNGALRNVKFQKSSSPMLRMRTVQSHPSGSHYSGDMRGNGNIVYDINQIDVQLKMNPVRVTAHEMGHALGLYDRYNTPCRNLMSGGAPSDVEPSKCTSSQPSAQEAAEVDKIWASYLAPGRQLTQTEVQAAMADIAQKQAAKGTPCDTGGKYL
ncbi:snapalysin family zinc-dependent metalloprotease [Pseudonocardiaceae bacterium YIM PH 21723]|nr:snapalysin family zinc-dependent metalloprotease [Pseudonocardiaceae bacterium YIM PH 21723]